MYGGDGLLAMKIGDGVGGDNGFESDDDGWGKKIKWIMILFLCFSSQSFKSSEKNGLIVNKVTKLT